MKNRSVFFIILALIVSTTITACDPKGAPKSRSTEFVDGGFENSSDPQPDPDPLLVGTRDYTELAPMETPAVVREREVGPQQPPAQVKITAPKLVINVDTQEMTFNFTAESRKYGKETIETKGAFERANVNWLTTLYPADKKILEERRIAIRVWCLTAHYCDVVAVNIYYDIGETETKPIQLVSGVSGSRIAMSGDEGTHEDEADEEPPKVEPPPTPAPPRPTPPAPPKRSRNEPPIDKVPIAQLREQVIEYPSAIAIDPPEEHRYRPRSIRAARPTSSGPLRIQAKGYHDGGSLINPRYIPALSKGFVRKEGLFRKDVTEENSTGFAWSTDRAFEMLTSVGEVIHTKYPNQPFAIGDVAKKIGGQKFVRNKKGKLVATHKSHQTGLDLDMYFMSTSGRLGSFDGVQGTRVDPEFDLAKNWEYFKAICAGNDDWVMVAFVHNTIKQALCEHAKKLGEPITDPNSVAFKTLRCLQPEKFIRDGKVVYVDSHQDHIHVRLYCPKNDGQTAGCGNRMVSLPAQTGCR